MDARRRSHQPQKLKTTWFTFSGSPDRRSYALSTRKYECMSYESSVKGRPRQRTSISPWSSSDIGELPEWTMSSAQLRRILENQNAPQMLDWPWKQKSVLAIFCRDMALLLWSDGRGDMRKVSGFWLFRFIKQRWRSSSRPNNNPSYRALTVRSTPCVL